MLQSDSFCCWKLREYRGSFIAASLSYPGRGVGEPLNETGLDGNGLIIRGTHRLSLDSAVDAPAQRRTALADLAFRPLQLFAPLGAATPASWVSSYAATFSGLSAPVPPQLQVQ